MKVDDKVVIRFNPHREHAVGIVGTVVKLRPREGFGGTDLVDVEYVDPLEGTTECFPFAAYNLGPGDPASLIAMAERHEALARELRELAQAGEAQP